MNDTTKAFIVSVAAMTLLLSFAIVVATLPFQTSFLIMGIMLLFPIVTGGFLIIYMVASDIFERKQKRSTEEKE